MIRFVGTALPETELKRLKMPCSRETLLEHALLVVNGVRPMALIQYFDHERPKLQPVEQVLLWIGITVEHLGLAFRVVPFGNKPFTAFILAKDDWVLDFFMWFISLPNLPDDRLEQMTGLLLGYSTGSIGEFMVKLQECQRRHEQKRR